MIADVCVCLRTNGQSLHLIQLCRPRSRYILRWKQSNLLLLQHTIVLQVNRLLWNSKASWQHLQGVTQHYTASIVLFLFLLLKKMELFLFFTSVTTLILLNFPGRWNIYLSISLSICVRSVCLSVHLPVYHLFDGSVMWLSHKLTCRWKTLTLTGGKLWPNQLRAVPLSTSKTLGLEKQVKCVSRGFFCRQNASGLKRANGACSELLLFLPL